jgi:hypothetical protein
VLRRGDPVEVRSEFFHSDDLDNAATDLPGMCGREHHGEWARSIAAATAESATAHNVETDFTGENVKS